MKRDEPKGVYCPGAVVTAWVTLSPDKSPVTGLYGRLEDGTIIDSQGRPVGAQHAELLRAAWPKEETRRR